MARREVLRATESQCMRLGGRVRSPRSAERAADVAEGAEALRQAGAEVRHPLREAEPDPGARQPQQLPHPSARAALVGAARVPAVLYQIDYTHIPLDQQFDTQGIRQIELDVWADPAGGLYANRNVMSVVDLPTASGVPALEPAGLQDPPHRRHRLPVTCFTFKECLTVIKTWSDAHPKPHPDRGARRGEGRRHARHLNVGFVTPVPLGPAQFDALDDEIRSVLPPEKLITPDDVALDYPTLEDASSSAAGRRSARRAGRSCSCSTTAGTTARTTWPGIRRSPGASSSRARSGQRRRRVHQAEQLEGPIPIAARVAAGYVVRTRADADTEEARDNDTTTRDAAIASGAQWVSTDYPGAEPGVRDRLFRRDPGRASGAVQSP
jgi:hypothetical protein